VGAAAQQPLPPLSALLLSASVTKTSELMLRRAEVAVCCETYAEHIIIIIIINAIELSLGGSIPNTSTGKTNKNKYA
jgi:hypothetical protein